MFRLMFTAPPAQRMSIHMLCGLEAGGCIQLDSNGTWLDGSFIENERMVLFIVTHAYETVIDLVLDRVRGILREAGERSMWWTLEEVQGGITALQGNVPERAGGLAKGG